MSHGGKKRGRGPLSPEEKQLWQQVVKALTPLPGKSFHAEEPETPPADLNGEVPPSPKRTQIAPSALRPRSSTSAPSRKSGPLPAPKVPALAPLDRRMRQKVARGKTGIDARIDLHGMTQDEAHGRLRRFLSTAQVKGHRLVLVITGKGGRSGSGEGVLRRMVPMWLSRPEFRALVIDFDEADIGHGGAGALYVRVRRTKKR
ncbi:Smr/MutS family protein [Breoghania sp.]|uniref:Smr/MutS family protein n=1 Tax=Breoghania sp. TaxID=2065378 RepID=UPI00261C7E95|nr:Smr/MutS family protein [Breoghania sp.]MDJ0933601.1 Smr/MutS family protein [Breoghania sp.]